MTTLPRDLDNNPIPALRLNPNGAHIINTTSSSSTRNNTAFIEGTRVISLYATAPVFIKFGDAGVDASASDHYFPSGLYYDFAIGGDKTFHNTHVSVLGQSSDAVVYISEKE